MLEFILSYISVQNLMWVIVAVPLFGFIVNGLISLFSNRLRFSEPGNLVLMISVMASLVSFVVVIIVWYILYNLEGGSPSIITGPLVSWKGFLIHPLEFGLKADQLSLVTALIISFIGFLTHLYSLGFVSNMKNVSGYFSLFNLLLCLVLLAVFAESFFMFFMMWQMIGVVGYVFINNGFTGKGEVRFATTYYIVEALSGSAFLLVMFLVWKAFLNHVNLDIDIFQFGSIQAGSSLLLPYAGIICIALFIGVVARSLQFPFYVRLPSETASPLPVFTFLFAVASVLVSIYILVRLNFLLVLSPKILSALSVVGAVGCVFGAAVSVVQKDIRKILAYLIISQVGLALMAIGVGAFASSVFLMFTYAVYVSSLFLGVGSVIESTGCKLTNQLGGLKRHLPVTFWTTLAGALAASGIYPLSGFFGKSGVLWEVYQRGYGVLFLCGFLSSLLVAISMFRFVAVIFFGKVTKTSRRHMEESSVSMLVPMMILAFASVVIGWFGVSRAFGGGDYFREWLEPGLATQMVHVMGETGRFSELVLAVITTIFVVHAGLVTWIIYVHKKRWPLALASRFHKTYRLLINGFYLNRIYEAVLVKPLVYFSNNIVWRGLDNIVIEGVVVGSVGRSVEMMSKVLSRFKVVVFESYVFWLIVGLVVLTGWCVF